MKTSAWLIRGLALGSGLFFASLQPTVAQTESSVAIRVESNQVLVPVFVYDKQLWDLSVYSPAEYRCLVDSAKALQKVGISVRQAPAKCTNLVVDDLTPKDFRVFDDGVEQTIQNVSRERRHWWQLFDNYGSHSEYSGTPIGKWSTADFRQSVDWHWSPPGDQSYVIAYVPPHSAESSCHQIKISVNRRNVVNYNRAEYCNIQRSLSDPLEATKFGRQLESALASSTKPQIPMFAESGVFFADSGAMRVHLVLEFPQKFLHREWVNGNLVASIALLGIVYRKDGGLAERFSDQACCPRDIPLAHVNESQDTGDDFYEMPARYEAAFDASPGEYDFQVILSDGKKFGRIAIPLKIESHDENQLALSSVALCKRFHRVDPPSYTEGILPSKFVPLISKGVEFTPAADTAFKKRDPLFAYFEVHDPHRVAGAAANVQFQLRITNADTGQLKIDSGQRPAGEFFQAGRNVIPIVQEVAIHDLPKGNYRLEVQASDSAGNRTSWRAATFAIR